MVGAAPTPTFAASLSSRSKSAGDDDDDAAGVTSREPTSDPQANDPIAAHQHDRVRAITDGHDGNPLGSPTVQDLNMARGTWATGWQCVMSSTYTQLRA